MATALIVSNIPDDIRLYRIPDAVKVLGLSRTTVYELIRAGRLRAVKEGRTTLIPAAFIRDYIALLEREAEREVA